MPRVRTHPGALSVDGTAHLPDDAPADVKCLMMAFRFEGGQPVEPAYGDVYWNCHKDADGTFRFRVVGMTPADYAIALMAHRLDRTGFGVPGSWVGYYGGRPGAEIVSYPGKLLPVPGGERSIEIPMKLIR